MWREKLNSYCKCLQDIKTLNNNFCDCNAYDLKYLLLSNKAYRTGTIARALLKLSIFTTKEAIDATTKISGIKSSSSAIYSAIKRLKKEGFHVFTNKNNIINVYDKNKL